MFKTRLIFIAMALWSASLGSVWAYSHNKVIYGEDGRRLVSTLDPVFEANQIEQARSIFAFIPNWRVSTEHKNLYGIKAKTLEKSYGLCPDERFLDEPAISSCTGFLVAPDLLMTAGHCIKDFKKCDEGIWALDYDDDKNFKSQASLYLMDKDKTYRCQEVVAWSQNTRLDYALIKLDRPVTDRKPLKVRTSGKLNNNEGLYVLGHPLGLPKMLANDINVRNNNLTYTFTANADTFSGNSGSPIFSETTGIVEGMLVRGDDDMKVDLDHGCRKIVKCLDHECRGETMQRSTYFPFKYFVRP